MITPQDIIDFSKRIQTSIRDKVKRASITRKEVGDRFDELAGFIGEVQQSSTLAIKIAPLQLQPDGKTYINNNLSSSSFILQMSGIGLLREGEHYTVLPFPQKGFKLADDLVLGGEDIIILTASFISPEPGGYSDLYVLYQEIKDLKSVVLQIRLPHLEADGFTYKNNNLLTNSFILEMSGVGILQAGIHYELLLFPDKGFKLYSNTVLGPEDLITLIGAFVSPEPGGYSDLYALCAAIQNVIALNKAYSDLQDVTLQSHIDGKTTPLEVDAKITAYNTQIVDGATADGNTLKKLLDKIIALQVLINGDDINLDTIKELADAIKAEGGIIDELTNSKVNYTDIYNALDAVVVGKTLDARQGKVLNDLIAATNQALTLKADTSTMNALVSATKADLQLQVNGKMNTADQAVSLEILYADTAWSADKLTYTFASPVPGDYNVFSNQTGKYLQAGEVTKTTAGFTLSAAAVAGNVFYAVGKLGSLTNYTSKTEFDLVLNGTIAKVSATLVAGTQLNPVTLEVPVSILIGQAFRYNISIATGIVSNVQLYVTYDGDSARTQLAAPTQNINGNHDFIATKNIKLITVYVNAANVIGSGNITVNYCNITELPLYKIGVVKADLAIVKQEQTLIKSDVTLLKQQKILLEDEIADVRGELNGELLGTKVKQLVVGTNVDPGGQEIITPIKKGELFRYVITDPTKAVSIIALYVTYEVDTTRTLLLNVLSDINGEYQFVAENDIKAITVYAASANVVAIGTLTVQYFKYGTLNKDVKFLQKQSIVYNNSNPLIANYPVGDNNRLQFKGTANTIKNNNENNILSKLLKPITYIAGKQNVIKEDLKIGDNGVYSTTNKIFNDINLVTTEYINPTLKKRESKNSTVVDAVDGVRTRFQLPEYINKQTDVDVYVNGLRMQLNVDYNVYPTKKCIVFIIAPAINSKIILDYEVYVDEFNIDLSFNGLTMNDTKTKIIGIDTKTINNNNANYIFDETSRAVIAYEGTDLNQAYADIVPDPLNSAEKALQFHIVEPNALDATKSRIQLHVQGVKASEVTNVVDVFLPTTMSHLEQWSQVINWLTIQEWWCDVAGAVVPGKPKFRATLMLLKRVGVGQKLYFSLKVEDLNYTAEGAPVFTLLYELVNEAFIIPFNSWFTLSTTIVAGDASHGYFKLTVKQGSGPEVIIFDQTCQTQATGYYDLTTLEALYTREDVLKLYTSAALTNFMKDSGRTLDIYFKNWKFKGLCVARY